MFAYCLRRILATVPIVLGITLLTFALFNLVGRNPALIYAGKNATAAQIHEVEHQLGLDQPLSSQYFTYLKQLASLDFGTSWATKQDITSMISHGIGASLSLAVPGFLLTLGMALAIALLTAYFRGTVIDRFVTAMALAGMSISVLVYIILLQYVFAYRWGWFPISGYDQSWLNRWPYLVLGWLIWVAVSLGSQTLFFRTVLIEESFQDYIRTARAKGLSKTAVFGKHVLKNAMVPIITVVSFELPLLFTGSIFIESFFQIPGLGGMMIQALGNSDFPVIKAMTFIGALLYVSFNLIADICYVIVDPRIRLV
jgi:peptide/nickel transport system permease protein